MKQNISDVAGTISQQDGISIIGEYVAKHYRANPAGGWDLLREVTLRNVVTASGLNRMANKWCSNAANSAMQYIVIGTQTAAHSLDSDQPGMGEVARKIAAVVSNSREWAFLQNTWGGASDSLTGVVLDSVGVADFATSHATTGILGSAVNGLAVTLQGSDMLDVTYRARVGSHNLSHTT
jgi:hypothetical protein